MHQNPWWLTPDGPTLDSGAYVAGLEFATETRARIVGKPSRRVLRRGHPRPPARGPCGGRACARDDIAMVGDDVRTDIRASQRAGLRGIFVRTGKHDLADVEAAATERGRPPPGRHRRLAGRGRRRARLTATFPARHVAPILPTTRDPTT